MARALHFALAAVLLSALAVTSTARPVEMLTTAAVTTMDCSHLVSDLERLDPSHWRVRATHENAPDWHKQMLVTRNYHLCFVHTGDKDFAAAAFPTPPDVLARRRRNLLQVSAVPAATRSDFNNITAGGVNDISGTVNNAAKNLTDPAAAKATSAGGTLAWKNKLETKRVETKANVSETIDKVFDQAIAKVDELQPAQQDAAADLFVQGIEVVTNSVEGVFNEFTKIFNSIADLIKGVFSSIVNWASGAYGTLKSTANTVGKIFGF